MGKVLFPRNAPWLKHVVPQLLSFPAGKNDDAVDVLSLFGRMLDQMKPAPVSKRRTRPPPYRGPDGWMGCLLGARHSVALMSGNRGRPPSCSQQEGRARPSDAAVPRSTAPNCARGRATTAGRAPPSTSSRACSAWRRARSTTGSPGSPNSPPPCARAAPMADAELDRLLYRRAVGFKQTVERVVLCRGRPEIVRYTRHHRPMRAPACAGCAATCRRTGSAGHQPEAGARGA